MGAKVFVLNPPWPEVADFCRSARWAARSRGRVQRHPDWMLIAVAVLEGDGHDVRFIDGATLNMAAEEVRRELERFSPDVTVLHTTTPSIDSDIAFAAMAKEATGCTTVLIGPHVTAVPDDTLARGGDAVDAVARGEYDLTLRDIARGIPLKDVLGVSFKDGSQNRHTPPRPPIDVNDLPFPAWHHVEPEWYWDGGKLFPFLTLLSGRGCHGRCTFCRDTQVIEGRALRLRTPDLVVDEIEHDLHTFPQLQEIMFETDTFAAVRAHTEGVCREILDRGLEVTWSCNARVDIDLDLLPLMRKAGCRMLMTGFEFGSQEALDAVRKGVTLEQSRRFAERAHELEFTIHGCFMVGAPGETRESAEATLRFSRELHCDTIQVSGICTYPGTALYDWAAEHGYMVPTSWREWVSPEGEQVTLLDYPDLSKGEIDELIDKGLREFYLRPGQMARMARDIATPADLKRKLFGLRSFVDYNMSRFRG